MSSNTARAAHNSRAARYTARGGFAVNGLLHILIGVIALQLALPGGEDTDADQGGALRSLADTPFGGILLWVVTIGLAALGLWLIIDGVLQRHGEHGKRILAVGIVKGLTYLVLAGTALTVALGGSSDSSGDAQSATAALLQTPGGVVLLVAVGLAIIGVGLYFGFKGVTQKFREDLRVPSGTAGRAIVGLGVGGYIAKGIALLAVGGLIVTAAVASDSARSTGLDGGLRALLDLPYGVWILGAVGVGLIAYGVYCFARARFANLGS